MLTKLKEAFWLLILTKLFGTISKSNATNYPKILCSDYKKTKQGFLPFFLLSLKMYKDKPRKKAGAYLSSKNRWFFKHSIHNILLILLFHKRLFNAWQNRLKLNKSTVLPFCKIWMIYFYFLKLLSLLFFRLPYFLAYFLSRTRKAGDFLSIPIQYSSRLIILYSKWFRKIFWALGTSITYISSIFFSTSNDIPIDRKKFIRHILFWILELNWISLLFNFYCALLIFWTLK